MALVQSMGLRACAVVLIGALCGHAVAGVQGIRVEDDTGRAVVLPMPARRIISLAPHTTELLFAAGAGSRIVATVDYSDYPPAARAIPRIGGSSGLDLERILTLKPDLIVGWASGNPRRTIERLQDLGLPVYLTEPRHLADIARDLEQLGRLAGTSGAARPEAARFTARYRALAARYADRARVRVFYQVLDPLLITVNGEHLISEILNLCGGENIFAALPVLAPVVGEEAVIKADPDAIMAGGTEDGWRGWRARWRERADLTAARRGALYFIPADTLHRHGPRVLDGAEQVCAALDDARRKR
jgi:iron complex transport system substrate-binding protein